MKLRKLNVATHRDVGYFFSSLIVVYCLSGIALNHMDNWNPDFIISKKTVSISGTHQKETISNEDIHNFGKMVGEEKYKVYDFPTHDKVKIYYDNASLLIYLNEGKGVYEKVSRRPLFYQSNILHRNNVTGWKWFSDIFAVMLILITITGLFILKGKHGISGRGKWLIIAGALPPLVAIIINEVI